MAKVRARGNATGEEHDTDQGAPSDSGPIGVSPDKLNFEYTVSGTNSLKPETVFDDGTFIWIRMPPRTPFAVPTIKDGGDVVSPNFIRRGPYIVIQRLADEVKLTRPGEEVTITRGRRGLFGF